MFTVEDVENALDAAVKEMGDGYVYERVETDNGCLACLYQNPDGTPSCIVGHVAYKLGISLDRFTENRTFTQQSDELLDMFPPVTQMALNEAQNKQDEGETWGVARDVYLCVLEDGV